MKKLSLFLGLLLFLNIVMQGQVGINPTNSQPDPSAGLDVNFNNKGLLPPRLTTAQRNAIENPAEGLTIYNTDIKCLEFYAGTGNGWYCPCSISLGTINCESIVVNGEYEVGVPLAASNSVSISITPTRAGAYNITSNTVNGFQFSKSGTFANTLTQTVTLNGSGTPLAAGTTAITVSYGASSCTFTTTVLNGELIYFGHSSKTISSNPPLTAEDVKSFPSFIGKVGGPFPNPRIYVFANVQEYHYWAIPDLPYGDGSRVINVIQHEAGGEVIILYGSCLECISQTNPETTTVPPNGRQEALYYLMDIDGVSYRIYRTRDINHQGAVNAAVYSIP